MSLVIKEKGEAELSPHLALCDMENQKGAANKRNVSLLMKSDVDLTTSQKELLKSVLLENNAEFVATDDLDTQQVAKASDKKDLNTNKEKEDYSMNEDIKEIISTLKADLEKSNADVAAVRESIEKANKERDEAVAALSEIKKAAAEQKLNDRLEVIKSVVKEEDKAASLHKAIGALEDEAFSIVVDIIKAKDVVEASVLTKQMSLGPTNTAEVDQLGDLLRKKYAVK